ncbi:hypothetical protein FSST1_008334 [Fusarium sambucinum]
MTRDTAKAILGFSTAVFALNIASVSQAGVLVAGLGTSCLYLQGLDCQSHHDSCRHLQSQQGSKIFDQREGAYY